ncbi:hypothetical protein C8Q78DRAFT_119781 [Trametes maxima]|nr:hypothetical protein C8Q78DRAFT_119781 [Trametes maxima]
MSRVGDLSRNREHASGQTGSVEFMRRGHRSVNPWRRHRLGRKSGISIATPSTRLHLTLASMPSGSKANKRHNGIHLSTRQVITLTIMSYMRQTTAESFRRSQENRKQRSETQGNRKNRDRYAKRELRRSAR